MNDVKRIRIDKTNMSVRSSNAISRIWIDNTNERITYLDELKEFTAEELLEKPNCGRFTLREVRKTLASYGMSLRGDILADSEAERKLIQDMPAQLDQMNNILREIERKTRFLINQLDQLHCNFTEKRN